jgi:hypothetical protein
MDGAAPTSVSGRVWHPWLRVSRLILTIRFDALGHRHRPMAKTMRATR